MHRHSITYRPIGELRINPDNAKVHPPKQLAVIRRSLARFDCVVPLVIDDTGLVLCGNGRLVGLKELGYSEVPTVCVGHLSEAQRRAFALADNKSSEGALWDADQLAGELTKILNLDPTFEITDTGFEIGEVDYYLGKQSAAELDATEPPFDPDRVDPEARDGDLFFLGPHLLLCGTALDALSYKILLGSEKVDLVLTDPPYGCKIEGFVSGLGKTKHADFLQGSGEMSREEFAAFLEQALGCAKDVAKDGALIMSFMDYRQIDQLITVGRKLFGDLKSLCVWDKGTGGMGAPWRNQHELVAVFKHGKAPSIDNVKLGALGRNRTTIWRYPGMSSFGRGRMEGLAMHPTVKNLDMVSDAIMDTTNIGGLVLDPFAGSGTVCLAAHYTRRRAAMMELDPKYCDVILRRFVDATGIEPINAWTGKVVKRKPLPVSAPAEKGKRRG